MTISDIVNTADQRMYQAKSRYYARRGVDRRGNQDAFRAISDTYRLILRAVLNEDECSVIRMERSEENYIRKSISEWVNYISASGIICEEDVEKFRNRFDISSLKDYFKNNDVMSFSCRRIVDNEIRNVIVDIIRSKDYEEDFQLVYIYIKVIGENFPLAFCEAGGLYMQKHCCRLHHPFRLIFLTVSRTFRTREGETESSSIPIRRNVSVSEVSAASSPQMPIHMPFLWAFSADISIRRRIAS